MDFFKQLLLVTFLLSIIGCGEDSKEELRLAGEVNLDQTITYNANIAPLIANRCFQCHDDPTDNGAPAQSTWINFDIVRRNADLINTRVADGSMPPSGGLIQSERDIIARWIEDGMLEN